jgi:4'-phosphopantetheinyl transferase EntD
MTHCVGYLAAAHAPKAQIMTIGIDAEPHLPLPAGVLEIVASGEERRMLGELSRCHQMIC